MITFTDAAYGRVMDRLNNARQLVQCARVLPDRWEELINEAHRILGECAEALKAGVLVPDGPELAPEDMVIVEHSDRVMRMTQQAIYRDTTEGEI